jgi:Gpi18-like mannosyltransferase
LRACGVGIVALLAFAAAYVHQPIARCPTAESRLDLLHALVCGTVKIDRYEGNTPDKASYGGHSYSDKAPGTFVLAVPAFAASVAALKVCRVGLDSPAGWLFSSWGACLGSVVIVAALGGGALFGCLSRRVAPAPALVTTLAIFLGAAPLPYATMMFSHSLVVGLIAIAMWAILRSGSEGDGSPAQGRMATEDAGANPATASFQPPAPSAFPTDQAHNPHGGTLWGWVRAKRWELWAGFASGWALASEYTAGIVVAGLFLWTLSRGRRRMVPFLAAAVPPLLLIPLYSWLCFGHPFTLPYSLNQSFSPMREGLYGIKWPDGETACELLFGPTRGLLFWTPFLAVAGVGWRRLFQKDRGLFWLTHLVPLLQLVVISGRTCDWQAGPSLGPRYLAPILPLLAFPCALGAQRFPLVSAGLACYSIGITTLATLTNACPSGDIHNPLAQVHIPLLAAGSFAPNLGTVLGLQPYASVAVFYVLLAGGIWRIWRWLPEAVAPGGRATASPHAGGEVQSTWVWVYAILAGSLLLRLALVDFQSHYYRTFLSVWCDYIVIHGQWASLVGRTGNYPPLYLYLLVLSTLLPLSLPYAVKVSPILGDYAAAWFVWRLLRRRLPPGHSSLSGLAAFLFLPTLVISGTLWAQWDSMFAAAMLASLDCIIERRQLGALLAFGLAASFKPQAVFLTPLLAVLFLNGRLAWKWAWVPAGVYALAGLPVIVAGRSPMHALMAWAPFPSPAAPTPGAANLFQWLPANDLWWVGLLLALAAAVAFVRSGLKAHAPADSDAWLVCGALLSVLLAPFLLPAMPDRCFFIAEVFSLVYVLHRPPKWWVPCLIQLASALTYVPQLFGKSPVAPGLLAAAMGLVILAVLADFMKLSQACSSSEKP